MPTTRSIVNRLVKRTYDVDGAGSGAATTQYWVYDQGINAVMQFDGSSGSNLSHRYFWTDAVDELMADEIVGTGADTLYALPDHLGTIRDIVNYDESTGTSSIVNHRTYSSFGTLVSETNSAVDLIFGYTGKQLDDATGLQHNLFRWYDSSLGQWVSEDPMGFAAGDENVRRYVGNLASLITDGNGLLVGDPEMTDAQKRLILLYLQKIKGVVHPHPIEFMLKDCAQCHQSQAPNLPTPKTFPPNLHAFNVSGGTPINVVGGYLIHRTTRKSKSK